MRPTSNDPGYANATTIDQSAKPVAPGARPPIDPSTRFAQPLLTDWTPADLGPHTEEVEIYTNAAEVELFLNGKSLGTQKLHEDASPITFKVPFAPGTIRAVAKTDGKVVATDELKTAGKPARIVFTADSPTTPLTPDWNDVRFLTATLVDAAGSRIPDSTTMIHFAATGPGAIVAVDNGNLQDHDPYQATQRKLYDGHAVAMVRASGVGGQVTVTATADGLPPASVTLATAPVKPPVVERSF
jgi:beta-galactosidase